MADLALKIKMDSADASRQFHELSLSSETARKQLEKFADTFKHDQIDAFIDRQKLMSIAMSATGRDTDGLSQQINAYQREIERLIKSGLDPQDEAIQKLQSEYITLKEKQEAVNKSTEEAAEAAKKASAENARLADMTGKLLDAHDDHERTLIKLNERKKELKDQIKDLIKSGISPESDEVKKLESEYNKLTEEVKANEMAHKMQEKAVKAANAALIGIGASILAAGTLAVKAAADVEDQVASLVPMMGGSEEAATNLFKTIQKEAATTPFAINSITASVRTMMPAFQGSADEAVKAFRMLGDTAQGNSQKLESITNAYTKAMMKNKVSMQELNTINSAGVPIFNEMAASMGINVEKLMEMSKQGELTGEHLTGAFKRMTSEGGLFFNGMDSASDTFNMRILGIKENMTILAGTIGEKFLPMVKDVAGAVYNAVASFNDWIQEGDNFEKLVSALTIAVAGATAALITFTVAMKIIPIIQGVTKAIQAAGGAMELLKIKIHAVNAAIKANPIGLIAGGIAVGVAALTTGIGLLAANQKEAEKAGENFAKNLNDTSNEANNLLNEFEKLNKEKEVDLETSTKLIKLYPGLVDRIDTTTASVEDYRKAIAELNREQAINTAMDYFRDWQKAQTQIYNFSNSPNSDALKHLEVWENTARLAEKQINTILGAVDMMFHSESGNFINLPVTPQVTITNEREINDVITDFIGSVNNNARAETEKSLQQRLNDIQKSDTQELNERVNIIKSFLSQRANLENVAGDERIEFYEKQKELLLSNQNLSNAERLAAEQAVNDIILEINQSNLEQLQELEGEKTDKLKEEAKKRFELFQEKLNLSTQAELSSYDEKLKFAKDFFAERAKNQSDDYNLQIEYLQEYLENNLNMYEEYSDERIAIEKALTSVLEDIHEKRKEMERAEIEEKINHITNFLSGINDIFDAFIDKNQKTIRELEKNNRELKKENEQANASLIRDNEKTIANLQKKNEENAKYTRFLSAAEAGINSALAFTKALTASPPPFNIIAAAGVLASGIAQQVKIQNTKIPSFETGGRFIVPKTNSVDGALFRANQDEVVNITPRGMSGNENFNFNLIVDGQVFANLMNVKARAGELYNLVLAT